MRRQERNERQPDEDIEQLGQIDDVFDIDLNLDGIGNQTRGMDHVKIIDGSGNLSRGSRRRLDDLSDDLSSIPSYDDARRNAENLEVDQEAEDIVFGDKDGQLYDPQASFDNDQNSSYTSNLNESSATIDSEMMAAYQHAIQ